MRLGIIVVIALGCGSGAKATAPPTSPTQPPPTQPTTTPPPPTKTEPPPVTAEAFCARFTELVNAKCGEFADTQVPANCVEQIKKAIDAGDATKHQVTVIGRCIIDNHSCEEVTGCLKVAGNEEEQHGSGGLRACTDQNDGRPVGVPRAEFNRRNGASATKYSQVRSTKDRPAEICGIGAGNDYLIGLACEDGSHPLKNHGDAEGSRVGNVGPGGRCGSIVDLYRVKCPEASYDIYTDGYVCPLDK